MQGSDHLYNRFWFVWLISTLLYLLSFILLQEGSIDKSFEPLFYFLGLFVPFGFLSIYYVGFALGALLSGPLTKGILDLIASIAIVAGVALLPLSFWLADRTARGFRSGLSPLRRLGFNLLWLLLLTLAVDLLIYHQWVSLMLLFGVNPWQGLS